MSTYCGSGFFLLICVQLYKQNRYRDTEIKGHVEGVESSSIHTLRAVMLYMSEVSKVHTGLSIQSYVTHVEGVKSSSKWSWTFLLITFLIFNQFSNPQKVLESWDLELSNHTIKCYVCWSMLEVSKVEITFDTSDKDSIWWYGWKALSLSFPKLFPDWKSIEYYKSYE